MSPSRSIVKIIAALLEVQVFPDPLADAAA